MPPLRRAQRSDAQENRARIIEAARAELDRNPTASLQSVAKAAGIGQGTLYRHFPDRDALLLAAYGREIGALTSAAPLLLEEHEPVEALRRWLTHLAAHGRGDSAVSAAMEAATRTAHDSHHSREGSPVAAALDLLLSAGKEVRQVRPDAEAHEVLLLCSCLWKAEQGPAWPERSRRMLAVITDGLRIGAAR